MKKFIVLTIAALLVALGGQAYAESITGPVCPAGQKLRKIGTVATAELQVSSSGHDVRAIVINCGGTACQATIYDADAPATEAIDANVIIEPGAAANDSAVLVFSTPLDFSDGIYVQDDGNVGAVQLYECR